MSEELRVCCLFLKPPPAWHCLSSSRGGAAAPPRPLAFAECQLKCGAGEQNTCQLFSSVTVLGLQGWVRQGSSSRYTRMSRTGQILGMVGELSEGWGGAVSLHLCWLSLRAGGLSGAAAQQADLAPAPFPPCCWYLIPPSSQVLLMEMNACPCLENLVVMLKLLCKLTGTWMDVHPCASVH